MNGFEEWRWVAMASLTLSDEKLLGVLSLVEKVADREQAREVLDQIRPRLAALRPPRRRTPQRLLFSPVEDLFDPPERYRSRIGRLSRQVIRPCWLILSGHLAPELAKIQDHLNAEPNPQNTLPNIGAPIWQKASAVLLEFLSRSPAPTKRSELGALGPDMRGDTPIQLRAIAEVFAIGEEIETAKLFLPERPITLLSEVDLELLRGTIATLAARSIDQVQTFLLVMLARMAKPGDLLKTLAETKLPFGNAERNGMVKTVGTNLLASLVFEAQDLKEARDRMTDPIDAARTAERLIDGFLSLEKSLGRLNDRSVSEKVQAARTELGSFVLDSVVDQTDQALAEALIPDQAADPLDPAPENVEKIETAERCALSLRRCARIADAVGVKKEVDRKLETIRSRIVRDGLADDIDRDHRQKRLIRSVRLIELIAGPDEAEKLLSVGSSRLNDASTQRP